MLPMCTGWSRLELIAEHLQGGGWTKGSCPVQACHLAYTDISPESSLAPSTARLFVFYM